MKLFDTHAHYNDEAFNDDRDEIINQIFNEGVTCAAVIGYDLEHSKKAVEIANDYEFIYAVVRNTSKRYWTNRTRNR